MKKAVSIILCLLMLSVIIWPSAFAEPLNDSRKYHGVFNQVYVYDDMPTLKIEAFYDDGLELSRSMKKDYEKCMSYIPREQTLKLKQRNVVVHLVDNVNLYYPHNTAIFLTGFYDPNTQKIFIDTHYTEVLDKGYAMRTFAEIETTLYHELGHALDWAYGKKSDSKEFKEFFKEEREWYPFGGTKPSEFFANLFRLYVVAVQRNGKSTRFPHEILVEHCPKSSAFLMKTLNLENPYTMKWKIEKVLNKNVFERFFENGNPKLPKFLNK